MADEDNAQPYRGEEKIIVAIDLGITQSQRPLNLIVMS
jgi:hypothetical protein